MNDERIYQITNRSEKPIRWKYDSRDYPIDGPLLPDHTALVPFGAADVARTHFVTRIGHQKDAKGEPLYERNPDGSFKLDEQGEQIPKIGYVDQGEPVCCVEITPYDGAVMLAPAGGLVAPPELTDPATGEKHESVAELVAAIQARTLAEVKGRERQPAGAGK